MYIKWFLLPEKIPKEMIVSWYLSPARDKDPYKNKTLKIQKDVLYDLRKGLFRPLPNSPGHEDLLRGWVIIRFCHTPQRLKREHLRLILNYLSYALPHLYHLQRRLTCKAIIQFLKQVIEEIPNYDILLDF